MEHSDGVITVVLVRIWAPLDSALFLFRYAFGVLRLNCRFEVVGLRFTIDRVYVLEVATQVSALREVLLADIALVGPRGRVLAEVVPQVAALAEDGLAAFELAAEEQLGTLRLLAVDLDRLVPLVRDPTEPLQVARRAFRDLAFFR